MPTDEDLRFDVGVVDLVTVEFYLHEQEDGRFHAYGQCMTKGNTGLTFPLDDGFVFNSVDEAKQSIWQQAKVKVAGGFTGDEDDARAAGSALL